MNLRPSLAVQFDLSLGIGVLRHISWLESLKVLLRKVLLLLPALICTLDIVPWSDSQEFTLKIEKGK